MLAQQENLFPGLFQSILKTIRPLMLTNIQRQADGSYILKGGAGEVDKVDDGGDSDLDLEVSLTPCEVAAQQQAAP